MSSPPLASLGHQTSNIDISPSSTHPRPLSWRSTSFSNHSPVTPRTNHRLSNASRYSTYSNDNRFVSPIDGVADRGGMGNLADELGEFDGDEEAEWGEGEEEGDGNRYDEGVSGMEPEMYNSLPEIPSGDSRHAKAVDLHDQAHVDGARDSGIDVGFASSPPTTPAKAASRRKESEDIAASFSLETEQAMRMIEQLLHGSSPSSITEHETEESRRTIAALQDLGAQSSLESVTRRLATAHNSFASHISTQTRVLSSLASSLFGPFAPPLDPSGTAELVPLVSDLTTALPHPSAKPLHAMARLNTSTTDLIATLASLRDSLQISKQSSTIASRRLRTTLSIVVELRQEREKSDQAECSLEKGGWGRRLEERWCARECRDVVEGFENVCEGMRMRLVQAAEAG
ncbi:hypothetical protein LTR50_006566 [Elasticomyces elasticus]|nr:hypothetical protein LTR50_006566 [Elasticomyces elasticus]